MTDPDALPGPDAPYREHLFAIAKYLQPDITREAVDWLLAEADPNDELRVDEPQGACPDGIICDDPDCPDHEPPF